MKTDTTIAAVTLDVHGVLLLPNPAVLREAVAPFGANPDDQACWRAHFDMIHLIDQTTEPDWPAIHRAMAGALGVPPEREADAAPAAVNAYLTKQWIAVPGAAEALVHLESRRLLINPGFGRCRLAELLVRELLVVANRH